MHCKGARSLGDIEGGVAERAFFQFNFPTTHHLIPLPKQVMSNPPSLPLMQRKELCTSEEEDPKPIERLGSLHLARGVVGRFVPFGRGDELPFPSRVDPRFAVPVLPLEPVFTGPGSRRRVGGVWGEGFRGKEVSGEKGVRLEGEGGGKSVSKGRWVSARRMSIETLARARKTGPLTVRNAVR